MSHLDIESWVGTKKCLTFVSFHELCIMDFHLDVFGNPCCSVEMLPLHAQSVLVFAVKGAVSF